MNYTAYQIEDALRNQGIDSDLAEQVGWALGDARLDENQTGNLYEQLGLRKGRMPQGEEGKTSGNLIPNLAENAVYAIAGKHPILGMIGGNLANFGASSLTGNNYNNRASWPQLIGDAVVGMGGATIGGGIGRAIGGGAGSILGPIGTLVGGTLGGYLGAKLFPDGSKSVAEDDGKDSGGWGRLAAMASVPVGFKLGKHVAKRKMSPDAYEKWFNPFGRVQYKPVADAVKTYRGETKENPSWWDHVVRAYSYPGRVEDSIYELGNGLLRGNK